MSLDRYVAEASRRHLTAKERAVTEQVGLIFRSSVSVQIRKPRWMPDWLYRRLMRTIVLYETPLYVGQRENGSSSSPS